MPTSIETRLRTASREDVERLARPLWMLMNGCDWINRPDQFEHLKCAVLGLIAQLAYCTPSEDERKNPHRARIVPCVLYQMLLRAELIDTTALISAMDFQNVSVVRTRRFVALVIPAHDRLLIGVRGTQFAYDWYINLAAYKKREGFLAGEANIHAGFHAEAKELSSALTTHLQANLTKASSPRKRSIYISGHSLGGAIASMLTCMQWAPQPFEITACYTFGAPRICGKDAQFLLNRSFATRRTSDIVPCVPPSIFGYSDFSLQTHTDGKLWSTNDSPEVFSFARWIFTCAFGSFISNHTMDRYCQELMQTAAEHPRVKPYWKYETTETLAMLAQ